MRNLIHRFFAIVAVIGFTGASLAAQTAASAKAQGVIDKALDYFKAQQKPDHSWQGVSDPPAITAIVLRCFMGDSKYDAEQEFLDKAFDKLLSYQKDDGSISGEILQNYNTAIAVSALAASKEAEYKPQLDKAVAYLRSIQWTDKVAGVKDQNEKVDEKNPSYGGWGYGKKGRADGSNMQLTLDALHDAGLKPDDPAFAAALKFATRMQNLSETNDQPWAGNDGGFIYTPAGGQPGKPGESPAGDYVAPDGKRMLRSYGSMTYAGLKSMIYAGLTHDDPRVKAAFEWIRKNWTLDENPGMSLGDPSASKGGLYYYYMTLGRSLNAYDVAGFTDAQGKEHDWRVELIDKLASLQKPDGSFEGDRKWMEDNPILATAYSVLALQEAMADLKEHPAK